MKKFNIAIAAVGIAVVSTSAHAAVVADAVIADWDLSGMAGTEATQTVNSTAAGVSGTELARGAGLAGNSGANSMNTKGWNGEATDYISFGFTVGDGYSVDLYSLVIGTKASNTGPGTLGLYYSGDNFSNALYVFDETSTYTGSTTGYLNSIVDLTALQGLTGDVEFRIAQIGDASANGGATGSSGTFRIAEFYDGANYINLELNGVANVAAVPVPASLWLMGSGIVGLAGIARKRRAG